MGKIIGICLILYLISVPTIVQSQSKDYNDFSLETFGCKSLYKFKYEVSNVTFTFPPSNRILTFTPGDGSPVMITNPANKTMKIDIAITNSTGNFTTETVEITPEFCCDGNVTYELMLSCYTIDISCRNLCNGDFPDTSDFSVTDILSKCSANYCYGGGYGGEFNMSAPLNGYKYAYLVKLLPTNRTAKIAQILIGRKEVNVYVTPSSGSLMYTMQPMTYYQYFDISLEYYLIRFTEKNVTIPEGQFNVSVYNMYPMNQREIQDFSVYVFKKVNCTVHMLPIVDQYPQPVCELRCINALNIPVKYSDSGLYEVKNSVLSATFLTGRNIYINVSVSYARLYQSESLYEVFIPAQNYSMSLKQHPNYSYIYFPNKATVERYTRRAGSQVDYMLQTNSGKGLALWISNYFPKGMVEILDYFIPVGQLNIINMNASKSSRNRYVFTCYTDTFLEDVTYEWYWDDFQVSTGLSSSMVDGKSQGSIVFDMLKEKDAGNVTCHVRRKFYFPATQKIFIQTMDFPKVQLNATSEIIKNKNPINVSCTAPPRISRFFKVNNELVTSDTVLLSKEANVSCYAVNGKLRGEIKTLKISMATGEKLCPNETFHNLQWPETVAKSTANVTCVGEFVGTASRLCLTNGTWELPNIECVRQSIVNAKATLRRIEIGIETDFEASIESLANATKESLNAEEIDETISAVDIVSSITNKSEIISNKDVKNVVGVISNLLAEDTKPAWVKLEKKSNITAATVMKQMGEFGKVASEKLNETTTISTENLVLQLAKVNAFDNISFPNAKANQSKWVEKTDSNVFVPADVLKDHFGVNETVKVNAVLFRNMKDLLPKYENTNQIINSFVLSISLQKPLDNLKDKILLNFSHVSSGYTESSCNFWDFNINTDNDGSWSTRGCEVVKSTSNYTVCGCNHLTNFAILMNPVIHKSREILNAMTLIGCCISIFALVITIIVYVICWKYVSNQEGSKSQSVLLMNLCVSLILAYVIFLVFVEGQREKVVCTAIAALIQYFFLVVFFTMFAEGIDMAIALTVVFPSRFSRLQWLLLFSWVAPAIIVGISLGGTMTLGFGNEEFCWLTPENYAIWYFIVPAVLIILANIVFLILIVKALLSAECVLQQSLKQRLKTGARAIGILTPLLGFTWLFGILAINEDLVVFEYLFTISSSLQGFFIFIAYCIGNKQIRKNIFKKKRGKSVPTKPTASTSNSDSSKETNLTRESDIDESLCSIQEIVVRNSVYIPRRKNSEQSLSTVNDLSDPANTYYINPKTALRGEKI